MAILNINTDAVVKHTNTLEKMHRSALPVAIRGALNNSAFDVKQKTMPLSAKSAFTERNKTFFKANSRVDMAKGFNVKSMKAQVGFVSSKLKGGSNFAVKDLEQQEHGGTIKKKSFIPTDEARDDNKAKPVRPRNRLSEIKKITKAKNFRGNKKQRFIKAIHKAGKGGHVLGSTIMGENTLFKVNSLTKKGIFKLTPLYDFKKGRNVNVKAKGFMRKASLLSGSKLEKFYIKQAKFRIEKLRK